MSKTRSFQNQLMNGVANARDDIFAQLIMKAWTGQGPEQAARAQPADMSWAKQPEMDAQDYARDFSIERTTTTRWTIGLPDRDDKDASAFERRAGQHRDQTQDKQPAPERDNRAQEHDHYSGPER